MEREYNELDKFQPIDETRQELGNAGQHEFHFKEIEELREPLKVMLEAIREKLYSHEYDLIIGEDRSGRLPALAMRKFFEKLYAGTNEIKTVFISGGASSSNGGPNWGTESYNHDERAHKISQYLREVLDGNVEKKALIVTDTIKTGSHIKPIVEAMKKVGKAYDIFSIGQEASLKPEQLKEALGVVPVFGMQGTPSIYKWEGFEKAHRIGVSTPHSGIFAESSAPNLPRNYLPLRNEEMRRAREDAQLLSDQLYDWYQKTSDQTAMSTIETSPAAGQVDTKNEEVKK